MKISIFEGTKSVGFSYRTTCLNTEINIYLFFKQFNLLFLYSQGKITRLLNMDNRKIKDLVVVLGYNNANQSSPHLLWFRYILNDFELEKDLVTWGKISHP
jgi:hypothetical protein